MKYLTPRASGVKSEWKVSPEIKALVKHYALYANISENELVGEWLSRLKEDPEFQHWLIKKRRNKRAITQIYGGLEEIIFTAHQEEVQDGKAEAASQAK